MGSPRRWSNTELLLDAALNGAAQGGAATYKVVVCDLSIHPCTECYACAQDGNCSIRDDMTRLYDDLVAADCIIMATPVFFYGFAAQAKALVDRCQALWMRRRVLRTWTPDVTARRGALISVGATRGPKLFDGMVLTAKYFFDAVGVRDAAQVLVRGIDEKGAIRAFPAHLEEARQMGRSLCAGSGN
jgi:multimeric flavodoxin WrbA